MKNKEEKRGRPTIYSDEVVDAICEAIATSSKGIRDLCEENDAIPDSPDTIYKWLLKYPEFREKYSQAKAIQAEIIIDKVSDFVDKPASTVAQAQDKNAVIKWNQWKVEKLSPIKYGTSRVKSEVSGGEKPLQIEETGELSDAKSKLLEKLYTIAASKTDTSAS
jgi:hypothetical protein